MQKVCHCTEVHFASFLSGGFITVIVVNLLERKLEKRTALILRNVGRFENLGGGRGGAVMWEHILPPG